jgi:hypothetical protein
MPAAKAAHGASPLTLALKGSLPLLKAGGSHGELHRQLLAHLVLASSCADEQTFEIAT